MCQSTSKIRMEMHPRSRRFRTFNFPCLGNKLRMAKAAFSSLALVWSLRFVHRDFFYSLLPVPISKPRPARARSAPVNMVPEADTMSRARKRLCTSARGNPQIAYMPTDEEPMSILPTGKCSKAYGQSLKLSDGS